MCYHECPLFCQNLSHTLQFFPQNVILGFFFFCTFYAFSFETLLTFFMKHRGTFDCRVDLSPSFLYTFKKNQRAPPFHHSHHASRARQLCRYLWHCFLQARSCSSFVSRKCEILYIRLEGSIQLPDFVIQSLVSFNESASLSCGSMQVASLHLRACIPLHNHPCMSQQDNYPAQRNLLRPRTHLRPLNRTVHLQIHRHDAMSGKSWFVSSVLIKLNHSRATRSTLSRNFPERAIYSNMIWVRERASCLSPWPGEMQDDEVSERDNSDFHREV